MEIIRVQSENRYHFHCLDGNKSAKQGNGNTLVKVHPKDGHYIIKHHIRGTRKGLYMTQRGGNGLQMVLISKIRVKSIV